MTTNLSLVAGLLGPEAQVRVTSESSEVRVTERGPKMLTRSGGTGMKEGEEDIRNKKKGKINDDVVVFNVRA